MKLADRFFDILVLVTNLVSDMRFLLSVPIVLRLYSVFLAVLSMTVAPDVFKDLPVMYSGIDVVSFVFLDVISIYVVLNVTRKSTVV